MSRNIFIRLNVNRHRFLVYKLHFRPKNQSGFVITSQNSSNLSKIDGNNKRTIGTSKIRKRKNSKKENGIKM